jgi:cytochrome oxidase Cu insertion factor (SCO1/SenC/PrrC family)
MNKKMYMRVIAIVAVLVLVLSFAAGCGKKAKDNTGEDSQEQQSGITYNTSSDVTVEPQDGGSGEEADE